MPANLYGPKDNLEPMTSLVPPPLIRSFNEAKIRGDEAVEVWGTGSPRREFLYGGDLADACDTLLDKDDGGQMTKFGLGIDTLIKEFAEPVTMVTSYNAVLLWEASTPYGRETSRSQDPSTWVVTHEGPSHRNSTEVPMVH